MNSRRRMRSPDGSTNGRKQCTPEHYRSHQMNGIENGTPHALFAALMRIRPARGARQIANCCERRQKATWAIADHAPIDDVHALSQMSYTQNTFV
jgi:hypothetical protein